MSTLTFQVLGDTDWQAAVAELGLTPLVRKRSGVRVTIPFEEHLTSLERAAARATLEAAGLMTVRWVPDPGGRSQKVAAIAASRESRRGAAGNRKSVYTNGRGQRITETVANYERAAANKAMARLLNADDDTKATEVEAEYNAKTGRQFLDTKRGK